MIYRWFEAHAGQTPDGVAVGLEDTVLTYGELNRRANRLARRLRNLGVGPEVIVGLCAERCPELIIGILGILKAGGAYLPIDPAYPAQRQVFLLSDANVTVLLTQRNLLDQLPQHAARVVLLDETADLPADDTNLDVSASPDDLAYVIYTSGSTGNPKGVQVTHANITWLFENTHAWYAFGPQDIWTLFHSVSFDFSVWELWGALAYGGRLEVVTYRVSRSPEDFYCLVRDKRVTVLNQTPSAFRQLIRAEEAVNGKASDLALRYVIFGGEALDPQSLRPWFDRHGDLVPKLVNMYGITETTVHVTYRPLSKVDLVGSANAGTPIGRPIPGLRVHVLDKDFRPVPVGETGEIYVGGGGVARGYLHRPDLTAQRFVSDPFDARPGSRLYRSGDLARVRPDGDLEYLGRADDQVKIRGFRIELHEIEAALARYPAVRESVVVVREDAIGEKRLIAYVSGAAPDPVAIRHRLAEELPEHMRPATIVVLPALPLNGNGKIDRAALPNPEEAKPASGRVNLAGNEAAVAAVWGEVLGCVAGPDDNFFDIGGSSIHLVEVHARLRVRIGGDLSLVDLFEHPTVRSLARHLDGRVGRVAAPNPFGNRALKQREMLAKQRMEREARR
ncbi:MAG TPA: amino acid adenylation domain-containing protein [Fimbriiglobus sp.]